METMSTTPANEEIRLVSESVPTLWSDGIDVSRGPSHGKSKEGKAVEIWIALISFSSMFDQSWLRRAIARMEAFNKQVKEIGHIPRPPVSPLGSRSWHWHRRQR